MSILKTRFLILIISCFAFTSCTHTLLLQVKKYNYSDLPQIIPDQFNNTKRYKTTLGIYDVELTGILVVKAESSENILVSFVNEFGIKYFDARITNSNPSMLFCVKQLKKKIVTNVLLHNMALLFLPSAQHISEKHIRLGGFEYRYKRNKDSMKVVEFRNNNQISELNVFSSGNIEVLHTKPKMSLFLKPI